MNKTIVITGITLTHNEKLYLVDLLAERFPDPKYDRKQKYHDELKGATDIEITIKYFKT